MKKEFLHRRRLLPMFGAGVLVAALCILPGVGSSQKAWSAILGLGVGLAAGIVSWHETRKRIYAGNRVTLYFTDTLIFGVLSVIGLLSLVPRAALQATGVLARYPAIILIAALAVAAAGLGSSIVLFIVIRRHELRHGPLRAKMLYARSVTGAEGMMGRSAIVKAARGLEGTVEVGSELWKARSLNKVALQPGEPVLVRDIEGLCLLVERQKSGAA